MLKKSILLTLFLFFSQNCLAQSFEGQVILQWGGEEWENSPPAAPVITYIKGGKTLTKLITPYFSEYIYNDQVSGKIMIVSPSKKTGTETTLEKINEYVQKKHVSTLSEPKASGELKKIRTSIFYFTSELYTCDLRKGGDKEVTAEADIWVADVSYYFPKSLLNALKTSFPGILAGLFGGELFELAGYYTNFFDKGLVPVEFGLKKKGEKEVKSQIDFIWYDEMKLDDSTFIIPPDIKIEPMK